MTFHTRGFTLVEVLVTLLVFGVMSVASVAILNQTLSSKAQTETFNSALKELQLSHAILKTDLSQIAHRPIRDEYGAQSPVIFEGGTGFQSDAILKFVRDGWQNPSGHNRRSSLQKVHYIVEDGVLIRRSFARLDGAREAAAEDRVLLNDVENLDVSFFVSGQWRKVLMVPAVGPYVMPSAVSIDVRTRSLGDIRQVFLSGGPVS